VSLFREIDTKFDSVGTCVVLENTSVMHITCISNTTNVFVSADAPCLLGDEGHSDRLKDLVCRQCRLVVVSLSWREVSLSCVCSARSSICLQNEIRRAHTIMKYGHTIGI